MYMLLYVYKYHVMDENLYFWKANKNVSQKWFITQLAESCNKIQYTGTY